MMELLDDERLEQSAVVANCRMNRERGLRGSNGYGVELGFDPVDFLRAKGDGGKPVAWLDLCCGSGSALIEAARVVRDEQMALSVEIVGVDLVRMFRSHEPGLTCLRLVEASLSQWRPDRAFDLITCVHGLHYIGDKLGLIARAVSWLTDDGLFVANLDADNLALRGQRSSRTLVDRLRREGLAYDRRKRRIRCEGRRVLGLPVRYLGADDRVGPNYTGQLAVGSFYEWIDGTA